MAGIGGRPGANGSIVRAVEYRYVMGFTTPLPSQEQFRNDLQAVIAAQTDALPSRANIRALTVDNAVVLRGTVVSERERQVAEAIVKLTPGVYNLRNELVVEEPGR
jgi:hypothetical protein